MRNHLSRLVAAVILASCATMLLVDASPLRAFAQLFSGFYNHSSKPPSTTTQELAFHPSSSLQQGNGPSSSKSGAYFTIYRNEQGEVVCRASTDEEVRRMGVATTEIGLRPINHRELYEPQAKTSQEAVGTGLTIILRATQQLQQNPAAVTAFTRAAQNWETIVMSPVTIYIDVDFGTTFFGQTYPGGVLGATSAPAGAYSYDSVLANLNAEASGEGNVAKQSVFGTLPSPTVSTDLGGAVSTVVSDPAARAIGLLPAMAASSDRAAKIGFNSNFTFDFDPSDGITTGQIDFDAVATHEIGHALGFHSEAGVNLPRPAVLDLYRFRTGTTAAAFPTAQRVLTIGGSPDPLQFFFVPSNAELGLSTGGPGGSTANGGDGWQSSHWKHSSTCTPYIGIMDPAIGSGCRRTITSSDTLALSYFGYNLTNNNSPPSPPPAPMPPANDNFANRQTISGCSGNLTGATFGATSEANEPTHDPSDPDSGSPSHTVWFKWALSTGSPGTMTVTTQGSDFDTILAVYIVNGGDVGSLIRIASNDDAQSDTLTSSITFNANPGTIYAIVVDGWDGDRGHFQLNWNQAPCPTPTPTPTPIACPTSFIVNDNSDADDATTNDGKCLTSGGTCTLRAAITQADALQSCGLIDIDLGGISGAISLNYGLYINHRVNINGPGADVLKVMRSATQGTPDSGVIFIDFEGVASISGLTISNGRDSLHSGGGIHNQGIAILSNLAVTGNETLESNSGGGISNWFAGGALPQMTIINCTISGNRTLGSSHSYATVGGGIHNGGTLTIINSTISGNATGEGWAGNNFGHGGGIFTAGSGTLTLINSTVSSNQTGSGDGGGIYNHPTFSSVVNLKNTIVANNSVAVGFAGPDIFGTINSGDYNAIGNTAGASFSGPTTHNITNTNLLLGSVAANGGPTMTPALLPGSPAINAGNNALAVDQNGNALTTDQRGFSRIVSGIVDIGAFEFGASPPAPSLLVDSTNHVIAVDSVTFVRDPFSVAGLHNFSSDQRTRVMIFTSNLGLTQPSADLTVTAGGIPLTVEAVGTLNGVPDTSYIIVKLDPVLTGNVTMTINLHGVASNSGTLTISP